MKGSPENSTLKRCFLGAHLFGRSLKGLSGPPFRSDGTSPTNAIPSWWITNLFFKTSFNTVIPIYCTPPMLCIGVNLPAAFWRWKAYAQRSWSCLLSKKSVVHCSLLAAPLKSNFGHHQDTRPDRPQAPSVLLPKQKLYPTMSNSRPQEIAISPH